MLEKLIQNVLADRLSVELGFCRVPFSGKFPSESKSSAAKLLLTCLVAAVSCAFLSRGCLLLFPAKEESVTLP